MTDPHFPEDAALAVVRTALDEDLGGPDGVDVTTSATIPPEQVSRAHVVARADGAETLCAVALVTVMRRPSGS